MQIPRCDGGFCLASVADLQLLFTISNIQESTNLPLTGLFWTNWNSGNARSRCPGSFKSEHLSHVRQRQYAAQLWLAAGGLVFCWIRAQRQPRRRFNYTAGAGYG